MRKQCICSLPEYKYLDKLVKRVHPKHDLAIMFNHLNGAFLLVAVKHYTGYVEHRADTDKYDLAQECETFSFGVYGQIELPTFNDICPEIAHYGYGLKLLRKDVIIYPKTNLAFKHNVDAFRALFKATIYCSKYSSKGAILFYPWNNSALFDTHRDIAFYTIKDNDPIEMFYVKNDLL